MHVKIYTTAWCAFCRAEQQFLSEHNVEYEAVDIESQPDAAEEMYKLSGQSGIPYTVITRPTGTQIGILGFDRPRLIKELKIT